MCKHTHARTLAYSQRKSSCCLLQLHPALPPEWQGVKNYRPFVVFLGTVAGNWLGGAAKTWTVAHTWSWHCRHCATEQPLKPSLQMSEATEEWTRSLQSCLWLPALFLSAFPSPISNSSAGLLSPSFKKYFHLCFTIFPTFCLPPSHPFLERLKVVAEVISS